jgi:hypothetical protein
MKRSVIVAIVGLVLLWGWLRAFAWFDPIALCRIHIDVELLEGERDPIRAAIEVVRREDPAAYRTLCRWVDRIQEERQCDAGGPQAHPRVGGQSVSAPGASEPPLLRAREAPGCYVRGSWVIVLRRPPDGGGGPALVRLRAEALKRLAGYSQAFWLDRVR